MDHFGIGVVMHSIARVYFATARRTGRTTSLVESVKDGDRIIFANNDEAQRVSRLCFKRGVQVECFVVDPRAPEDVFSRGTPKGRTIFDHLWVEQRYLQALENATQEIDYFQREASGHGKAHEETKQRAAEIAKWPRL